MARTLKVISEVERTNPKEIVKPEELIDIRPARGKTLGLAARKYFNLMLKEAGSRVGEPIRHRILKRTLRQGHKSNDHLSEIIDELASTHVEIKTKSSRGREARALPQLIKIIEETDDSDSAWIEFEFDPDLRNVIVDSEIYASLQAQAVLAIRSKYSLVLYELGAKLSGRTVPSATFSIEDFRGMVGVPEGALLEFAQFRRRVLDAAKAEIDQLAHFTMKYEVKRQGKTPVALEFEFWKKSSDADDKTQSELNRHSAGRKARRAAKVEKVEIAPVLPALPVEKMPSAIPSTKRRPQNAVDLGKSAALLCVDFERLTALVKHPDYSVIMGLGSAELAEKKTPGAGKAMVEADFVKFGV
ncbi:MAG: replication initiation protein [Rhodocyclaceae bacterium]|nr:replication initiation protein [Rhodocyclaceae bacterium]